MATDNQDMLETLREALAVAPDNVPLRRQVAVMLMGRGELDDAEAVLRRGLADAGQSEALKTALADCFTRQGKSSEALVLLEDLASRPGVTGPTLLLLAKTQLKTGDADRAADTYRRAIAKQADLADKDLAAALNIIEEPEAPATVQPLRRV